MAELKIKEFVFTVDDDVADELGKFRWGVKRSHSSAGREYVYARTHVAAMGGEVLLHRWLSGAPRGKVVDHIDGDTFNNRRNNLRVCTQGENTVNRAVKINSKTGVKGVTKRHGRFYVEIAYRGENHRVGSFDSLEAAAAARAERAKQLHGEFYRP